MRTPTLMQLTAAVLAAALLAPVAQVLAQSAQEDADALFETKFLIDYEDPTRAIPSEAERNEAPLDFAYFIMNLSELAQDAEKQHDREAQIRYLRGIAAAVPTRSLGFSKLCAAYEANQQLSEAERSCSAAITLPGATLEDFARYVRVLFSQERELDAAQLATVEAVGDHLRREAKDSPILIDIECQLAIRTKDRARYAVCTKVLEALPDNDVKRLSYNWSWAMGQRDFSQAGALIKRAEQSALPSDLVERMARTRMAQMPWWRRTAEHIFATQLWIATLAVTLLCLFGLAVTALRGRKGSHKQSL
jgi:hypothetical protein